MRILAGRTSPITVTFYGDEAPDSPDGDVTVTVTNDRGEVLVDAETADEIENEPGRFRFLLTGESIPTVDLLVAEWTGVFDGVERTETVLVEVVGAFYFEIGEARSAAQPLSNSAKYPASVIVEMRDEVEDHCEDVTQVAWVPRYRRVRLSGEGTDTLDLPDFCVRRVLWLTVDGVDLPEDDIDALVVDEDGILIRSGGVFAAGTRNIEIGYEHGYLRPLSDIRRAALMHLKAKLVSEQSGIPDRATRYVPAGGGGTFEIATPGRGGSSTGIPSVDETYNRRVHDRMLG